MVVESFEWAPSTSSSLASHNNVNNDDSQHLATLCARWLANASDNNGAYGLEFADATHNKASFHRPSHFMVWTLGLSFVTIISLFALSGILVMKFMKKALFDKFITFFVSVGVGSLSGSAVFHLLPQAFGLVEEFDANASHAYLTRSFAAIVGIYLFFFSDKLIKIILETKKRKKLESTEMAQIDLRKHLVGDVEKNGEMHQTQQANSLHDRRNNLGAIAKFSTLDDCTTNSSDLLHHTAERGKTYLAEERKIHSHNLDSDESYNRQVHSICVHDHDMQYKEGDSVIATVAWMIIFGDGLHNFIDGISIGASFSESILSGLSVSLAVICEEFPHELGDVAILVSAGMTLRQALVYNLLSALSCYFGFVIGVIVGNLDETFASYTFGFAGGMFLYISMACMMPEMKNVMEEALAVSLTAGLEVLMLQAAGVSCGLTIMAFMARYGGEITLAST